jgi:hypothetical protein
MIGWTTTANQMGSYWRHIQSWWEIRDRPNVLLVHFNNLKADIAGEIRHIADFLAGSNPGRLEWFVVEQRT